MIIFIRNEMKIFELLFSEMIVDIHSPVDIVAEIMDNDSLKRRWA